MQAGNRHAAYDPPECASLLGSAGLAASLSPAPAAGGADAGTWPLLSKLAPFWLGLPGSDCRQAGSLACPGSTPGSHMFSKAHLPLPSTERARPRLCNCIACRGSGQHPPAASPNLRHVVFGGGQTVKCSMGQPAKAHPGRHDFLIGTSQAAAHLLLCRLRLVKLCSRGHCLIV